jgi:hypothetical protein
MKQALDNRTRCMAYRVDIKKPCVRNTLSKREVK